MKVSFIIPLFNSLPLTQAMLASLHVTLPARFDHEIIFVDDGSTDGTRTWLATLGQSDVSLSTPPFPTFCRVLLNERNLGFAASCNHGADAALGEVLIFLNNDLELVPGWLDPMLAALASDPKIGVVGNRQFRVDNGALDHAGLMVTARGKIKHVQTPARGATSPGKILIVPGVTAACFAVRRAIFLQAGKFDAAFVNGGEDVDFCFRLQERLGLRTVVAWGSVVRHHVSASRGPTNTQDERNSRLLASRWRETLIRWGALSWAQEQRRHLARPWSAAGRDALSSLPFLLGWSRSPPRAARRWLESGLHREEIRWQRLLDLPAGTPRAPRQAEQYQAAGFLRDELETSTAWVRDRARVGLPDGFPVSNIFLNGFFLPVPPHRPEAHRPVGVRLRFNGRQVGEFPNLPLGNFNLGLDAPFVRPHEPNRLDIELIGVARTNFLAGINRVLVLKLPLPHSWRLRLDRGRRQAPNRRLRFAQLVCDDEVIFDFRNDPPLAPALRDRLKVT